MDFTVLDRLAGGQETINMVVIWIREFLPSDNYFFVKDVETNRHRHWIVNPQGGVCAVTKSVYYREDVFGCEA